MKIMMAMSGGIDSSYSAKLFKDQGHEVIGCYMLLHNKPGYHEENIRRVKDVGKYLGIKTEILDLQDKFKKEVYDPFIQIYKDGKTPNPCALCNKQIKLGSLLEHALNLGCDKLATGHYVRIEDNLLKVAKDLSKDQSYFLANIDPKSISHIIFPLGDKFKKDVKEEASKIKALADIAAGKESSEICFVEKTYIEVLDKHIKTDIPGIVKDKFGNKIGSHKGYMHYTIGKRSGFKIDGAHDPHYVIKIDSNNNEIIVGNKEDLFQSEFETQNFNAFVNLKEFTARIKIRYRSPKINGKVTLNQNGASIKLNEPASGIASGQLAVFYDEQDRVLGSGFIK